MHPLNKLPLSALRAVEAIGRLGTLAAAADELGVTSGALSQRLAKAEARLGVPLFLREATGLRATEACERILPRLSLGMEHLASALELLEDDETTLTVTVAPIFASRWLIWRIHRFHELEPTISVRVEPRVDMVDFRNSEVDVGIRVGTSPGRHVSASKLLDQRVFPVCSPEIALRVHKPEDLLKLPIIRENDDLFGWKTWLANTGLSVPPAVPGPTYADASLCLDAAMTGQGVFMAWETLASDAIKAGQLVAPVPGRCETGQSYWFVAHPRSAKKSKTVKFRRWLEAELMQSVIEWRSGGD
ncbi:LysR substrate-binding domain-containing protein [uncultured Roseobacter sp.]|uniref:LysR substrate-binding domain-containing protein n=1 Tax=uncultured Roseobacter sp. TaxID=114847 RepID=UPI00261CF2C7|nr:LysR substrate-binding domain-containing protein [uncultured Roseobacter sp.]